MNACEFSSFVTCDNRRLITRCKTHNMECTDVHDERCPIGRIEAATNAALARLAAESRAVRADCRPPSVRDAAIEECAVRAQEVADYYRVNGVASCPPNVVIKNIVAALRDLKGKT
jgi:hypothetical protein